MVEHKLPKLGVAGSNPVSRSQDLPGAGFESARRASGLGDERVRRSSSREVVVGRLWVKRLESSDVDGADVYEVDVVLLTVATRLRTRDRLFG